MKNIQAVMCNDTWYVFVLHKCHISNSEIKKHKCAENISGRAARPVVFPHDRNRADSQLGNSTVMGVIQNN